MSQSKFPFTTLFMSIWMVVFLTVSSVAYASDGEKYYLKSQDNSITEKEQLYYLAKCAQVAYPLCLKKMGHAFLYGLVIEKDYFQAAVLLELAEAAGEGSKSKVIAIKLLTKEQKRNFDETVRKDRTVVLSSIEWPAVNLNVSPLRDEARKLELATSLPPSIFGDGVRIATLASATVEQVAWLQVQLRLLGLYDGETDGLLGPKTLSAVGYYLHGVGGLLSDELREILTIEKNVDKLIANLSYEDVATLVWKSSNSYRMFETGSAMGIEPYSHGSGFFINDAGFMVTNYHVVESCDSITYVEGERNIPLGLVIASKEFDVAVLKAPQSQSSFVSVSYPFSYALGTEVYAAGYPLAGTLSTTDLQLHSGLISAEYGMQGDANHFQTTVTINPGNSGGPVLDQTGRLVGIAVAKLSKLGQNVLNADGIHYAIKSQYLVDLLSNSGIEHHFERAGQLKRGVEIGRSARLFTRRVICWTRQ